MEEEAMALHQRITGLAIGLRDQYSTTAEVQRRDKGYEVLEWERWQDGQSRPTRYKTIFDALKARSSARHTCAFVVDITGVGEPILDMMRRSALEPIIVTMITDSARAVRDESGWIHIPRREVVALVQILWQTHRLTFHYGSSLGKEFYQQHLETFDPFPPRDPLLTTPPGWRAGENDDYMFALSTYEKVI